jgi:hypothetical protein
LIIWSLPNGESSSKYLNLAACKVLIFLEHGKSSFLNLQVWVDLEIENYFTGPGPHVGGPFPFDRRGRSPGPTRHPVPGGRTHRVESALRRWPPVVTAHVGWSPWHCFGRHWGSCSPLRFSLPSPIRPCSSLLCASHCFTHRCPSLMSRPEQSDQAKRSASSPRPSCTKSLHAALARKAGPQDFPTVVFLYDHLTGGSLLQLFPHLADPAASSAPPRSSSPTLTTPLAPHQRPLPIGTHVAVEAPCPMSTPFPAFASRFSCSM